MIVDRPEWHERAACCGMTDWFDVPPGGPGLASAQNHAAVTERLAVCATCTEHVPCALLGLERTNVGTGVWAGVYVPPKKGRVEAFRRLAAVAGVEPPRRPPGTLPAPCGTNAAYFRHRRDGEDACEPCKQAHALAKAERERARLQRARDAAPRRHAGGIVSHPAGTILGAEFSAGGPGHQISAMTTHAHNKRGPRRRQMAHGARDQLQRS